MEKILVTGAMGQIGTELTTKLRQKHGEKNVIAADIKAEPGESMRSTGTLEFVDVTKAKTLVNVLDRYKIDTIYHMAAILSASGEQQPHLAWNVNMDGLYNVLDIARDHHVKKVFFPSSIAVFGPDAPKKDTPQTAALHPTTLYGITKVTGELLCDYYFRRYQLDVRSLRYPGLVSSEALPGGGTTDYAVDIFYQAIKSKSYTCFVRENTILPMMYMPDAIRATIELMQADADCIKQRMSYNLAAMSFSAGELAREIARHIPEFICNYQPDIRQQFADSWPQSIDDSPAREDWQWQAQYNLAEMTKDMLEKLRIKLSL